MSAVAKPEGSVVNCSGCGRDTRSKTGICQVCSRHNPLTSVEQWGRPALATNAFCGSAIEYVNRVDPEECPVALSADAQYHGDTVRDDVY